MFPTLGVTEAVTLGRFVLRQEVGANGESMFIARCFAELRRAGVTAVESCADPVGDGSLGMVGAPAKWVAITAALAAGIHAAARDEELPGIEPAAAKPRKPSIPVAADTLDALYRYALATFYTSPSKPQRWYDFRAAHERLIKLTLIERTELGRFRPTELGWRVLDEALDADKRTELDQMKKRRDAHKVKP